MKGELYSYQEQMLSQADIAKLEGINRTTLADWYKKTGNMEKAVEGAKKSLAQRNIQYYDEILSLKAIAQKEKLNFETLKKNYEKINDIYKAVEETRKSKEKRNGNIEYNGQMLTIFSIANLEGLEHHALGRYYKKTNDIYESVKLAKQAKEKQQGTIPYKGELMSITKIANIENIKRETLNEFYEIYGDIEKAVFITKESQLKRKRALYKGKEQSYLDIAKALEISTINLDNLIQDGKNIEEIEKGLRRKKQGKKTNEYLMHENESLYKFCIDHSYNYWVISYMINTYGKSIDEAIKAYIENGQQIPTKWIYEKYSLLFKHLTLSLGLDSNRIIKIMKNDSCTVEEAITKLIFTSNNQNNDLRLIEIDWLQEIYQFLLECSPEERTKAIDTFYINERELKFLNEKDKKIKLIKRRLLLFEISEIIDNCSINELNEIFEIYELTENEIKFIFTELYLPFDGNIMNPKTEILKRKQYLNSLILNQEQNLDYDNLNLSIQEIFYVKNKKDILKQIMDIQEEKKDSIKTK